MRLIIRDSEHGIVCAIIAKPLLAAGGLAEADIERCMQGVPAELRPEVERAAEAVRNFIEAWLDAPRDEKPTKPVWCEYIRYENTDTDIGTARQG